VAALIAAQKTTYRIPHVVACRALGVSQSWFYKWKSARPGPRAQQRDGLKAGVARLFAGHEGEYGSPLYAFVRPGPRVLPVHGRVAVSAVPAAGNPHHRQPGLVPPHQASAQPGRGRTP
jgi:hypothetical protein